MAGETFWSFIFCGLSIAVPLTAENTEPWSSRPTPVYNKNVRRIEPDQVGAIIDDGAYEDDSRRRTSLLPPAENTEPWSTRPTPAYIKNERFGNDYEPDQVGDIVTDGAYEDESRRRTSPLPPPECNLRAYDADKEADIIQKWHDLVKTPIDEESSMRELLLEACDDDEKDFRVMCAAYAMARMENKRVPGLTRAECMAVTMYTYEGGGFYREFNNASAHGTWAPYRVFTSLLFSAVKKLAAIDPVPYNATLYRGMNVRCRPPNATRIFWKTFTSTTPNKYVANYFGTSTWIVFEPKATFYGARIRNLSSMEWEDEVLIPPFEVFEFVKSEEQKFYFSASQSQDLFVSGAGDSGYWSTDQRLTVMFAMLTSLLCLAFGRFNLRV